MRSRQAETRNPYAAWILPDRSHAPAWERPLATAVLFFPPCRACAFFLLAQKKGRPRERRLRRPFACSPCGGRRVNSCCALGQYAPLIRRLGCAAQPLPMGTAPAPNGYGYGRRRGTACRARTWERRRPACADSHNPCGVWIPRLRFAARGMTEWETRNCCSALPGAALAPGHQKKSAKKSKTLYPCSQYDDNR